MEHLHGKPISLTRHPVNRDNGKVFVLPLARANLSVPFIGVAHFLRYLSARVRNSVVRS
jgi:hypothetical protein